jgi:hypothetical protein
LSATLFVTLRDVQILRVRRGWGCHAKAAATWAAVDRQLTNNAIWAPTISDREVDLVSRHLHNYEYNPVGIPHDQSWLG